MHAPATLPFPYHDALLSSLPETMDVLLQGHGELVREGLRSTIGDRDDSPHLCVLELALGHTLQRVRSLFPGLLVPPIPV
jgi:hypothetical protein